MDDPDYDAQKAEKFAVLQAPGRRLPATVLADPKFAEAWTPYPFNSGYFMCLKMHGLDAEAYRREAAERLRGGGHLHQRHRHPRRHSCVDEADIADLYDVMLECALEMRKG